MDDVRRSYDAIAASYAEQFFRELDDKPLDRALLDVFAAELPERGRIIDLGCGPGHVTRYLAERGADCTGIDLSPELIEVARRLCPGQTFEVASMLALGIDDGTIDGITAFYSIVHFSHDDLARAFREMARVLRDGAPLLFSFHLGDETRHVDEMFGESVSLDFHFFPRPVVEAPLEASGLVVEVWVERSPYPKEHPTKRAYVLARARPPWRGE